MTSYREVLTQSINSPTDANYTVSCTVSNVTNPLSVAWTNTPIAASVGVVTVNAAGSALAASGTLHCVAVHD